LRSQDYLTLAKKVFNEFKNVMENDKEIKTAIIEAGGLIGTAANIVDAAAKAHDNLKSEGEKAYALLLKYLNKSINESLKDMEYLKQSKNFDKKDLFRILESFREASRSDFDSHMSTIDWTSNLLNYAVVNDIRSNIEILLTKKNYNKDIINNFMTRFNSEIENKTNIDEDIKRFRQWWRKEQQNKDLVKYLEYTENIKKYATKFDNTPLDKYYVHEQEGLLTKVEDTWGLGDEDIRKKYSNDIINAKQIINEEIHKQPYIVIGASFGSGKTSMARMIASEYASICLVKGYHNYIPILVFLKGVDLRVEYEGLSLDNLLQFVVAPKLNPEASTRKILLILDGLDEYGSSTNTENQLRLIDKLDELKSNYPNIKAIITTRLEDKILENQGINIDTYVRLLLFSPDQVNDFFKTYGVIIDGITLTYDMAKGLNLPVEEMTKPLFAWIFSYLEMHTSPELKIETKQNWNYEMVKSWIFLLFFHQVIEGKYRGSLGAYIEEKKILRRIAALNQIYGDTLTWQLAEQKLKVFESTNNNESKLKQISRSQYFFYKRPSTKGEIIDFVHKTFKEYLLAEYYIESLVIDKIPRLNTRAPSKEVILFLDGLVDLLGEAKKDNSVEK
jgi:NACHT domain